MLASFSTRFATASLLGLGAGALASQLACQLPSTIGLSCTQDSHCSGAGAQYCGDDGRCVAGVRGDDESESESESEADSNTDEAEDTGPEDMSVREDMGGPGCGAEIGSCDMADVLIVVDNSGSATEDELLTLVNSGDFVGDLLQILALDPCDVHIGVTTTEEAPAYQPDECKMLGALNRGSSMGEPDTEDCWNGGPPYFQTGGDVGGLLCAMSPGDRYDDNERQMLTILNALGSEELTGEGGCNEGFLRDEAKLFVFLVTDEDDDDDSDNPEEAENRTGSPGGPEEWIEALMQIKPLEDIGFISIMATNSCEDFVPQPGNDDGLVGTAESGQRLGIFVGLFAINGFSSHTETINICQPLDELVEDMMQAGPLMDTVCNG